MYQVYMYLLSTKYPPVCDVLCFTNTHSYYLLGVTKTPEVKLNSSEVNTFESVH